MKFSDQFKERSNRRSACFAGEQIESRRKITDAVHDEGGVTFLQIFHTGRIAPPDFLPAGVDKPEAPSGVKANGQNYTGRGRKDFIEPRELSAEENRRIGREYGEAARGAVEKTGFDGVELHGANGCLVQQFLDKKYKRVR